MITKISEIDNDKLVKLWNNPKKSNKALMKEFDCNWSLINTKAKRVKAVADKLTVERSSGAEGGVVGNEAPAKAQTEEKKVTTKSTDTAAVAAVKKTVAKNSDAAKDLVRDFDNNFAVYVGDNDVISWSEDPTAMRKQIEDVMRRLGKKKVEVIRDGGRINIQDIRPGDKIVLQTMAGGAAR